MEEGRRGGIEKRMKKGIEGEEVDEKERRRGR